MALYKIEDLTFSYNNMIEPGNGDTQILKKINLTINEGEYLVLCGKSGSGKTTFLRNLKGVLAPEGKLTGRILFDDRPMSEVSVKEQAQRIGFVMQDPDSQIVTDKVWHELAFGLESLGMAEDIMRMRVAEMAGYFGIQSWFHKDVSELSGGQKQLLNLASVLVMQPDVLILDEPTSQLDPVAASDFLSIVRQINTDFGTTVILSEHRLDDVLKDADRVLVMSKGQVVVDDRPCSIGGKLKEMDADMFCAMPASLQIYYSVKENLRDAVNGKTYAPLTIRDSRKWLKDNVLLNNNLESNTSKEKQIYSDESIVSVKDVCFRYEKDSPDVLKNFTVDIPKGTVYTIAGGNAAGKTTALKAIAGLVKPYHGRIIINGKKLQKYKANELYKGVISMLPQDPRLLFVRKTVELDLEEMLNGQKEEKGRMDEVIDICGIRDILDRHPYDISGGQIQMAALAKVLLNNPQILLLDEPSKGIDAFYKKRLGNVLRDLTEKGITVIMVTHDIEFAARYSDITAMFFDGRIVSTGTPHGLFENNRFYTTAAGKISRGILKHAVLTEEIIKSIV